MKRFLLVLASAVVLSACAPQPQQTESYKPRASQWEEIRIDYIDYPKHFRMTYTVLSTGQSYKVSSKHCSSSRNYNLHDVILADISQSGCSIFSGAVKK